MANKRYIQKGRQKLKKGSIGSFTKHCGGRVTQSCIDSALKSDNPDLVRKASLARSMKQVGGPRKAQYGLDPNAPNPNDAVLAAATGDQPAPVEISQQEQDTQYTVTPQSTDGQPAPQEEPAGPGFLSKAKDALADGKGEGIAAGVALGKTLLDKRKAKQAEQGAAEEARAQRVAAASSKDQQFASMDTGVRREEGGTRKLPGGLEIELRNGAKKFVGNKHDQAGKGSSSGIVLEEGTKAKRGLEVEDGELEVDDSRGGSFIVSDYLKNPKTGNTLAEDLESELEGLDKDKDKQQIKDINDKYIALNEELKDKKSDTVDAANGMRRKYMQDGGSRNLKTFREFEKTYPNFDDPQDAYQAYIMDMTKGPGGEGTATGQSQSELDEVNKLNAAQGHADLTVDIKGKGTLSGINSSFEEFDAAEGLYTDIYGKPETTEPAEDLEYSRNTNPKGEDSLPLTRKELKNDLRRDLIADKNAEAPKQGEMERPDREERRDFREANKEPRDPREKREKREKKDRVPFGRFYGQGTGLQATGALAYLSKKDDPEAPVIAPGYVNRVPPARFKSFAPERAAAEQAFTAQSNAISTSIAGPAAIAARQAAAASNAANMDKIGTAETRDRLNTIKNNQMADLRVAMMNQRAFNNANRANATAKYVADREKFQNKYTALDKIGDVSAQSIKDRNAAVSEDLTAEATQIGGAYTRAKEAYDPMFGLGRLSRKKREEFQNRQTGLSSEDAASLALLNKEKQEGTNARMGKKRYIKKSGKVRRRRTKKK
tara:strand:+ start:2517 stop:4835 length:2319 start_codon:yes stop_codon:yes gene_type:complete